MWCARCQADVAAEVSPDARIVRCANCGSEIGNSLANRTESRTRQARALLERWSQEREGNPFDAGDRKPLTSSGTESQTADVDDHRSPAPSAPRPPFAAPSRERGESPFGTTRRIDSPHFTPRPPEETSADDDRHPKDRPAESPRHATTTPVTSAKSIDATSKPKLTNWASTAGQWLAYSGILGLMTGTCLVILGYFRGPESYAPTGWLITTAGQMLLFLGVVTLVSSGIEESSHTVTEHISRLEAKLIRIEQATETLRAPHSLPQFERKETAATQRIAG